jgi:adenylylsulfate kinase-like enzyme
MIIWFTGLSGSGKTTFSKYLIKKLKKKNKKKVIHIDGDQFRLVFNDLKYSLKDRIKNAERVSKLVNFLNQSGNFIIIASILSISQKWLNWNKKNNKDYFQIFIDVPIHILKRRNIRNVYTKKNVVGININFLKPKKNFLVIKNNFKKKYLYQEIRKFLKNKKIKKLLKRYEKI